MKKICIFMAVLLAMGLFAGCGDGGKSSSLPSAVLNETSSETGESSKEEISSEKESSKDDVVFKEFPISKETVSDDFNSALEEKGYTKLYDWELTETEEDNVTAYEYQLNDAIHVVFYESKNKKLTQIFFVADTNSATANDMKAFGLLTGMSLAGMEPDLKYELDESLGMSNTTDDASNVEIGDNCLLTYSVDDGIITFNIMPK